MRRTPSVRPSNGLEFRSPGFLRSPQPISVPGVGSVYSRSVAGATVYHYSFLLATPICPATLWLIARRKLTQLNRVRDLHELAMPPANRLERLVGDRVGQYSIRINEQYRVCFFWENGYADKIKITDYH